MRRLFCAFAVATAAGGHVHAAAVDPAPAIDVCMERLFASEDGVSARQPIDELLLICPELEGIEERLDRRAFALLPADGVMSLAELRDLRFSLRSYAPAPQHHSLDHSRLAPLIQATLQVKAETPPTRWQQFKEWLREKLKGSGDPEWVSFLDRFALPEWLGTALLRGSMLLIILLAVAAVLNEMRAVPWRWSGFRRKGSMETTRATATEPTHNWDAISALPVRAQGAALFRWILARLSEKRLAREHAARTHREHAGAIASTVPVIAAPILDLAQAAERGIYAPNEPSADEVEQWREHARSIERALAGSPA